jgi:hypothetical protein
LGHITGNTDTKPLLTGSTTSQVNIIECDSFRQALTQATEEAGNTGGQAYPVVMFRQGNRTSFSGALPMKRVEPFLDLSRSSGKGDSMDKIRAATNRPHIPEHSTAIANYVKENPKDYIIPGLINNQRSGADQCLYGEGQFNG